MDRICSVLDLEYMLLCFSRSDQCVCVCVSLIVTVSQLRCSQQIEQHASTKSSASLSYDLLMQLCFQTSNPLFLTPFLRVPGDACSLVDQAG
jgi:hypothetical protein